ncbi:exodeoxyribonuclease V subunit gamma [Desulfobacterales bacterium HSG2]|nr:exodeoxyribonuclease V subunit gamma [Desulfobacterales bacterium HSG2]
MKLFTSNRLEILVRALARALETPLKSPLDKEIIVVQSKGMERWVSMELARHHGICANVRFLFPNAFVYDEIFRKVIPDIPERSPYDPEFMTWKIMRLLRSCVAKPEFEHLRSYFRGSRESLKRFQLSERIARTFDQYLIFRPDMILKWELGKEDGWQAILWRELVRGNEEKHRAALAKAFFEAIEQESRFPVPNSHLSFPERISVFGISSLPRFHIQVFDAVSRFTEVNLFLMNPCQEYWSDILSNREKKLLAAKENAQEIDREYLYLDQGNSFLASMGMLGRDFFELVGEFDVEDETWFEEPGEERLLLSLQSDILNLRDRGADTGEKMILSEDDHSIQIHSCHSPMREIEVLHDRLLEMFEDHPGLTPGDILVMTPDIEACSPYIQAVFDLPKNDPRRIPFSIADRSIRVESRIVDTFMRILDLTGSRFGAAGVFSILEYPGVYRKFDLSEADLDLIQRWVQATRIRWGIDAQNRGSLGLPDLPENTWKTGLERLLLGYAMPGREEKMFAEILPYDFIEGNEAAALGKFLEFANRIFSYVQSFGGLRTLSEWSDALKGILDGFFRPDEDSENEIQTLREALNDLAEIQRISEFDEKTDIHVIRCHLSRYIREKGFGLGFITGGVTFCAMLPMRSIPFKVLCLVGMNSDAYPRLSGPLSFDLMAKRPRRGDPSRRNDDRYLFLESILSAREKLYISYAGQSLRDNSAIPPSVLVSEIMDYIRKGFEIPGKNILSDHIVVKHRLQAFSPEYFRRGTDDSGRQNLFSYSEENLRAARCLVRDRKRPRPFISKALSDPESELKSVRLTELCHFFGNPAKFLLNNRLKIYLEENGAVLEEKESFYVDELEKYFLKKNLVGKRLEGRDLEEFFALKKASGQLPHGTVGECVYEKIIREVDGFVRKIRPYIRKPALEPLEVDLSLNGFRLYGRIDSIYPERLFHYRYATVKSKDRLKLWIHHLTLNSAAGSDGSSYPQTSMLAGSDTMWEYDPVKESREILESLLEKYWNALRKPPHFFPKTSWEYAQRVIAKKQSSEDALQKARNIWTGNGYKKGVGEVEDSYFQLCFGQTEPFDSEFRNLATEVFEPLLEKQREIK